MLNRTTVLLVACAAATATAAVGAAGQQAPRTVVAASYSVHGTIVDTDGNPVGDAEVALLEGATASLYVRSDSGGHFRFDGLATPSVSVRVRRLGFEPRTVAAHITRPDRSASMFITLEATAAKLNAVNIDDDTTRTPNAMLAAFYERARTNSFGHYIDEAAFAKVRPQWVSEAMRKVPGVVIKPTKRIGNMVRIRGCGVPGNRRKRWDRSSGWMECECPARSSMRLYSRRTLPGSRSTIHTRAFPLSFSIAPPSAERFSSGRAAGSAALVAPLPGAQSREIRQRVNRTDEKAPRSLGGLFLSGASAVQMITACRRWAPDRWAPRWGWCPSTFGR